jgi:hypothetical protein
MQSIFLIRVDELPFDPQRVEAVLRADTAFREVRLDDPLGLLVEAEFIEPDGTTSVALSENAKAIYFSGTSDTDLRAALRLQNHLQTPLRIFDTVYSFALRLSDYTTLEDLNAAIVEARASQ